ncbi:MAG TPA: bifunctional alpha,alpha-trehalose-phosphate synthase (UDP-forming)/trehalose-phosphatase [Cyclobacteriaceae bacterium]|nr:bifunctional alpha,alpha-trehalose-phosphate synthase (UDP-forming)/trehalose-phosphatase [Cyclobacteriaceae bacterium]
MGHSKDLFLIRNHCLPAQVVSIAEKNMMMNEISQQRLILVSNRLPYQLQEKNNKVTLHQSDGGLVTALKSYFENGGEQSRVSEKIWLGSADFPERRWQKYLDQQHGETDFKVEPLFVDAKVYNRFYNGFCNATIWPLFHYFPSYVVYEEESFRAYEIVNQFFAEKLIEIYKEGDVIWIHDYQLFLLPQLIRGKIPDATIGFFLHIPFPSYEIFRLLHKDWKQKITQGMLGADLIGFHTHEYVQHFLKTVRMVLGVDHQYRSIETQNRSVRVDLFPLGVDYKKFSEQARSEKVLNWRSEIKESFGDRKMIFSVDRLDYTKGVTHRLIGFERFLHRHPEWHEKVVFVMVVVPSRQIISKYNERRKLIEEYVGRINGKYSSLQWQPLIYRYSHLAFDELSALYQCANVALITPLRDGMNLVAKEYIASRVNGDGVLILSELAGAASEMGEALLVNPMDEEELSTAIHEALTMSQEEQCLKVQLMQKRLIDYDVNHWVEDFLFQLADVKKQQELEGAKFLSKTLINNILQEYNSASSRHVFLDYDGTLVPLVRHPSMAHPSSDVLELLTRFSQCERTVLTIISGRDSRILNEWLGHLPLNLVAEHGAAVREIGHSWIFENDDGDNWKAAIRPTLELFTKRCPGSFVEEKNLTLTWHYRNVERDLGFIRSRELLDNLYHLIRNAHLHVIDGNKVIEVRIAGIDKGAAVKKILADQPTDFILAIGDDRTDEDMFRALSDKAVTIKVGSGHTQAKYSLHNQAEVIHFLNQLIQ